MRKAIHHLKKSDPVMRAIIERIGSCRMQFGPPEFHSLAEAIVYQQLNGKAAVTIFKRFAALTGEPVAPEAILKLRQGVGRLIRTKQDRGIVVILDNRILSRSYGQAFLRALPQRPMEVV